MNSISKAEGIEILETARDVLRQLKDNGEYHELISEERIEHLLNGIKDVTAMFDATVTLRDIYSVIQYLYRNRDYVKNVSDGKFDYLLNGMENIIKILCLSL